MGNLGWGPSRKQRECWQAKQRQDPKRKSLATTGLVSSSLSRPAHEGNLLGGPISAYFTDKQGKKGAINGVAHTILVIAYHMLQHACGCQERGLTNSTELTQRA